VIVSDMCVLPAFGSPAEDAIGAAALDCERCSLAALGGLLRQLLYRSPVWPW